MTAETKDYQKYHDIIGLSVWQAVIDFYEYDTGNDNEYEPETVASEWLTDYGDAVRFITDNDRRPAYGATANVHASVCEADIYANDEYGTIFDVKFEEYKDSEYWQLGETGEWEAE